ncbi:MAG TPA: response regulator [Planctomycetota bacterium]|jgi:DNA-binding response OmpR family regulator|nr:response regulator [Planctomycetota bacterium]
MPRRVPPLRILVADDEPGVGRLVQDGLSRSGYAVDVTPDGREALTRYRPGDYDLLILDSMLAKRSGLELVSKIRNAGDDVPIILTSGSVPGAGRVEPFAFTYRVELLRKPFGLRDLREAVERAVRRPTG